jgi:hypothetical protein
LSFHVFSALLRLSATQFPEPNSFFTSDLCWGVYVKSPSGGVGGLGNKNIYC